MLGDEEVRALLVGSPGLMRPSQQRLAQAEHKDRVFTGHGLTKRDLDLLGEAWCIRYVNARRAVERSLEAALLAVRNEFGIEMYYPRTELPPVPPRNKRAEAL